MNRSISSKILFCLVLLSLFSACKVRKVASRTKEPLSVTSNRLSERLQVIEGARVNFDTYSIKAKADFIMDGKSNSASMSIRMQKDQVIWASVTVLAGLEVARVMITPDSLKILNRFEGTYTAKPFSFIHQFTNPELDFKSLQAMLLGNPEIRWMSDTAGVAFVGARTHYRGKTKSLLCDYQFDENAKLVQGKLLDERNAQNLTIDYSRFANLLEKEIPQTIQIRSQTNNQTIVLDLDYVKIDVNEPVSFPFVIPKRFSGKN